jgi:prevent-host-death family protein
MHELKAGLSRVMARARAGEVIEVTSHDKPVARIVGIPPTGASGLTRLLTSGAAQWAGGKPSHEPAVQLAPGGKSLSEMILEDRG